MEVIEEENGSIKFTQTDLFQYESDTKEAIIMISFILLLSHINKISIDKRLK